MSDHPIKAIRLKVLHMKQAELAELAETTQATVSRWERGELEPDRRQMDAIREAAKARGAKWKDEWFFNAAMIPAARGVA